VVRVLRIVPMPSPSPGSGAPEAKDGEAGDTETRPADPRAAEATDDDVQLVADLRAGAPRATTELVDRYGNHVRRVVFRVLGAEDSESADLFQEVITHAWERIDQLVDPRALKAWLTQIAVFTARKAIRRRRRRRWLSFFAEVPEPTTGSLATAVSSWAGPELQEAARCVYRILERIPVDERIPFSLRMLDDLDLEATARACGMSVATVRRRLVKAERRFFKMARQYEALAPWLESGS
jgi:RNA polymerase sigma-70 factor (ECF subfamily)